MLAPALPPPPPRPRPDRTPLYVAALISLIALTVTACVILEILRPGNAAAALLARTAAILVPSVTGVVALIQAGAARTLGATNAVAIHDVHVDINSRLSTYVTSAVREALGAGFQLGLSTDPAKPLELARGQAAVVSAGDKVAAEQVNAVPPAPPIEPP